MAGRSPNGSVVREDGLRYASRVTGSPFSNGASQSMRSCFRCGTHRAPDQMKSQKILGKSQRVCAPNCQVGK